MKNFYLVSLLPTTLDRETTGSWAFANIRNTASSYTDTLTLNIPLNLTGTTSPQLTYWTRYQLNAVGNQKDVAYVQVLSSTPSGGQAWTAVQTVAGPAQVLNWTQKQVNLSAYAGQTIRLRFVLSATSVNKPGSIPNWWIDDVRVTRTPS